MAEKILIVDDENLIRWSLRREFEKDGYEVIEAASGEEAIEVYPEEMPDVAILDIKLPRMNGIEVLKTLKEVDENVTAIIITAFGDVTSAVEAMKLNAIDYITKPFNLEEVKIVVKKAIETRSFKKQVNNVIKKQKDRYNFKNIVAESESMKKIVELTKKVSQSEATTILIEGESGTGKDLIARSIHFQSSRRNKPFMEINCASIPENLLESELFGYEKGAFTDAKVLKKGLFELADGGTIFLDEIGEMPVGSQAKLLRAIETKSFKRLGGSRDIIVDVRIVASTNRNLERTVKEGKFREDLFYRINVIYIKVPPLRERKEDVIPLVNHFIQLFNVEFRKNVKGVSEEAMNILREYNWPGNVRELRNVIERAIILEGKDIILPKHLSIYIGDKPLQKKQFFINIPDTGISLEEVEKNLILLALEKAQGNKSHAAKLLNISRDTLRYRLYKYGIEYDSDFEEREPITD